MPKPLIAISRESALCFACFLVLYEFLTYISNDMILPGMLNVVKAFHAKESMVPTALTMYILGGASLQIILGPLSDAFGRRRLMLFGASLFFVCTILIAFSNSMHYFLIARFVQGMGLCFISVIGYATIQEIFEEMDAIRLIAIMANAAILAPLLGPILGAVIIHFYSWRLIFIMIALGALVALWGLWRFMPETLGQKKSTGEVITKTPFTLKTVLNNYKALLSNFYFCCSVFAVSLAGVPCVAWIALAPIILIAEGKLSVIQYGLWQLPIFGATIIGNWVLRRLTHHLQLKQIIFLGGVMLMSSACLIALLPYYYGNHYYALIPGIILYFFALALTSAPLNRYCLFITKLSKGTVSALLSLSVMSIGALGIELANLFYKQHNNFHFALFCFLIIALSCTFAILGLREREKVEG